MDFRTKVLYFACLVAAVVSASSAAEETLTSPCPEQFQYDGSKQPQQWEGTLKILTEDDLHGLWIRVKFDAPIKEMALRDSQPSWEVISRSPNNLEFLIKNPGFVLKGDTPTNVKITVKYDGNTVPRLIGYRLNAKTICPDQIGDPSEVFQNDANSKDLLSQIIRNPSSSNLPKFECGAVNPAVSEYPWQAAILFNEPTKKARYLCEATLITPKHLVTAAHCVTYVENEIKLAPSQLSVAFGKADLNHDVKAKLESGVANINVHPGYKFTNLVNDIAIIELSAPVAIDESIKPICLGEGLGKESKKNIAVGYALDKNLNVESKLGSAEVKEINSAECERRIPDLAALIGDNVYCATYSSDESQCVGDSGSSVASLRGSGNVWELRGIVTLGVALQNKYVCNQSATVLLVDISKHLRWIRASTL